MSKPKDPNRTRTGTTAGGRKYVSVGYGPGKRTTSVVGKGNATVHTKSTNMGRNPLNNGTGKQKDVGTGAGTGSVRSSPIKKSFTKPVQKK